MAVIGELPGTEQVPPVHGGAPPVRGRGTPTRADRVAAGVAARAATPRSSQGGWEAPADRADPVDVLVTNTEGRLPDLVPVHFGRMMASPLAFYRGAAAIMAGDLGTTPVSGERVQLCGDAHLSNFGGFASPERQLVFDLNDFDETLPGPWEWDLKRLVASFEVAGRAGGLSATQRAAVVTASARAYRLAMREFASMGTLQVWYARLTAEAIRDRWGHEVGGKTVRTLTRRTGKARARDSAGAAGKLAVTEGDPVHLRSDPPLMVPLDELFAGDELRAAQTVVRSAMRGYRRTLPPDRRWLLEQFHTVDLARKVVGVGSVGTRAWVLLMLGADRSDPLVLQVKEAGPSVLEPFAGPSAFANAGQRVVAGQRLMQASSDIFLGWTRGLGTDGVPHDYYVRQLWDWKLSTDLERQTPQTFGVLAQLCGWTLARAHARSGDRIAIGAYLGSGDVFDRAMVEFAVAYADQNEADHQRLVDAAESGRVAVRRGV